MRGKHLYYVEMRNISKLKLMDMKTLIPFVNLKQSIFNSLKELIRKNRNDVSSPRRWNSNISGVLTVVSSVSSGTKAFLFYKVNTNKWTSGNSNSYSVIKCISSRHNELSSGCWRVCRRSFCKGIDNNTNNPDYIITGFNFQGVNDLTLNDKYTQSSIADKGLDKELVIFNSSKNIIDKLTSFKRNKCGKFIDITKEFLSDPQFLKFSYFLIKNNKGISENLDGINEEWFITAAESIKSSCYIFKIAKQVEIPKAGALGKTRILTITNGRDKIIQQAITVILEMVYENNNLFQNESHGFRPNRGCHTALHQIKYNWTAVPYYIEADISKAFDDINRNVLINIINRDISDKRFIDLISKMYKVNILCPQGFWIKKNYGLMQGNILSPILCNIYLNELDLFIKNQIIGKFEKGTKPAINKEYSKVIGLKPNERTLPSHIQKGLKKSRRRHVEKLGIKRIIESEEFIRIKYVRYADDFIIGVRGSHELAVKIKEMLKNFLKSNLHLNLNIEKTKITNTYSDKAKFLGMYILNKNACDLPYRNSRSVENSKRVARKNVVKRNNATREIVKNTRHKLIKLIDIKNKDLNIFNIELTNKNNIKNRDKIRKLSESISKIDINDQLPNNIIPNIKKLKPKIVAIGKLEMMHRIHRCLVSLNALSTDRGNSKRVWPAPIKKILALKNLTYCPSEIDLNEIDLKLLIMNGDVKANKNSSVNNWIVVVESLIKQQELLPNDQKITLVESKASLSRIEVLQDGVNHNARPIIVINRDKVYDKLIEAGIMNFKKNPCCKANITTVSDYNIILYFNGVAHGLLSYYRCADDFYKMKSIVNWFIRYSAISTIKHKHKLASRKTVIDKYGKDLNFTNHYGKMIKLISTDYVMSLNKEYLINTDMDWIGKVNKVWTSFSRQSDVMDKCSVQNCVTPYDNIEMHHVRHLKRELDENGYMIIKGKGKKIKGWKALSSGIERKQIAVCRNHHNELHKKF